MILAEKILKNQCDTVNAGDTWLDIENNLIEGRLDDVFDAMKEIAYEAWIIGNGEAYPDKFEQWYNQQII